MVLTILPKAGSQDFPGKEPNWFDDILWHIDVFQSNLFNKFFSNHFPKTESKVIHRYAL